VCGEGCSYLYIELDKNITSCYAAIVHEEEALSGVLSPRGAFSFWGNIGESLLETIQEPHPFFPLLLQQRRSMSA